MLICLSTFGRTGLIIAFPGKFLPTGLRCSGNVTIAPVLGVFQPARVVRFVSMLAINRNTLASAAVALALMGGAAIGLSPVAAATNTNVTATGGDGTAVDHDGTQGSFSDAVQGASDSDGDQDAYLLNSEEAKPQVLSKK